MNIIHDMSVNELLKKLNTIQNTSEFAKELVNDMFSMFALKACWFCLVNYDTKKIEIDEIKYLKNNDNKEFSEIFWRVYKVCEDLLINKYDIADTLDYFKSLSIYNIFLRPIMFRENLIGYYAAAAENSEFLRNYKNEFDIITEFVKGRLETIFLYDELNRVNKDKVNFLAGISHEYKTPLNSILGFSKILSDKLENEEYKSFAESINKSAIFLLDLIQDILDLASAQAKPMKLKYTVFYTKPIINDIIYSFTGKSAEKNITISPTLADVPLYADVKRFKQLVYNLISNAVKFNKENGKIVIITYVGDEGNFYFEIKDEGEGIGQNDKGKIFTFFSQVSKNEYKREKGSGIGLALCKTIVENHNGIIDFKSIEGVGSTFWFSLPNNIPKDT